ncbi:TPA: acyltransferase, partial [Escherichia coli]|nr:acyltransferase [Escherichia coli]
TLFNIQALRFIAAAMVVLAHAELGQYGIGNIEILASLGGFGVIIFFIISGFIIPYVAYGGSQSEGEFKISAGNFFMRRVIRIIPVYALITALCVLSAFIVKHYISSPTPPIAYWWPETKISLQWYLESITFTHWHRDAILSIGWTLQLEFLFYTSFAFFIAIKLSRLEYIEILFLTISIVANILTYQNNSIIFEILPFMKTLARPEMVVFAMGMFMYRLYLLGAMLKKTIALTILTLFIPTFLLCEYFNITTNMGGEWHRPLIWGFFAFYGVWAALSLEGKIKPAKLIIFLGDASYSIYLTHGLITAWVSYMFVSFGLIDYSNVFLYIGIYFIISCALGSVIHMYIEKPIAEFLKRFV